MSMDARDFLVWSRSASASRRAEAAAALAHAYLFGDVDETIRSNLETAITVLLDDPAPTVRFALADSLANSPDAPRHVILSLAGDQTEIAAIVLSRSPVFLDSELVDLVGAMSDALQNAIASRPRLSAGVSAALTELGTDEACATLLANPGAEIAGISLDRLAQRFGDRPEFRNALLERDDLPIAVRHNLIRGLSEALGNLVQHKDWLDPERALMVAQEACDQATVAIAAESARDDLVALAEHLRVTQQLTTSLLLRTLCAGNLGFFAAALSVLTRMPEQRIKAIVVDRHITAFGAVYRRAGLPERAFDAFATGVRTCRHHTGEEVDPGRRYHYTRRVVDEVLARFEEISDSEMNELTAMLRRFSAEAGRAAAREYVQTEIRAA
jgi:uncharacterized protein (DUF2336 family)